MPVQERRHKSSRSRYLCRGERQAARVSSDGIAKAVLPKVSKNSERRSTQVERQSFHTASTASRHLAFALIEPMCLRQKRLGFMGGDCRVFRLDAGVRIGYN